MNQLLSIAISLISLVMLVLTYGNLSEAIAWVLAFTGWAAIAIYQRELDCVSDKTS